VFGQFRGALLRWVGHQQPAQHAPDHSRRPGLELEQHAELLDESLARSLVHQVQSLLNY
jgi:hypothetical protein